MDSILSWPWRSIEAAIVVAIIITNVFWRISLIKELIKVFLVVKELVRAFLDARETSIGTEARRRFPVQVAFWAFQWFVPMAVGYEIIALAKGLGLPDWAGFACLCAVNFVYSASIVLADRKTSVDFTSLGGQRRLFEESVRLVENAPSLSRGSKRVITAVLLSIQFIYPAVLLFKDGPAQMIIFLQPRLSRLSSGVKRGATVAILVFGSMLQMVPFYLIYLAAYKAIQGV